MKKTVLITGATSGICEATARAYAAAGDKLIITGRRGDRLQALKAELKATYGAEVCVAAFDVREQAMCEAAIEALPEKFRQIDVLVNNAGLAAGLEHVNDGNPDDWNVMIDTNIKGLLYISRVVVNLMVENGIRGHVVNIGSIAGTQVYENGNVYCATKHAVHALSQGMRIDFLRQGIRVTEIRPGMVETEFSIVRFHGDKQRADGVYAGLQPLTGKDVAEAVVWATSQPDHVHINEIVLTPTAQADSFYNVRK
jgi:NADP-dependent 3-hydroxy acid dehydrogenase YdfG